MVDDKTHVHDVKEDKVVKEKISERDIKEVQKAAGIISEANKVEAVSGFHKIKSLNTDSRQLNR